MLLLLLLLLLMWICIPLSSPLHPGDLQGGRGFLPVQHPGQLLLAAGGGAVPADPAGALLRPPEEVLLGVHPYRMG